MTDELRHHWVLHEIDEEAVRHEAERAKLPAQRQAHEAKVATERRRVEALAARATQLEKRRRELEREIAALESQEKRFRSQLDSVTDQKQYEAVQHEIGGVAGKRSDLETEALTLMEQEEAAATEGSQLAAALARTEHDAREAIAKLDAQTARLDEVIAGLTARRAEVEARLDPAARTRYQKLRASRGGRAVAALEKGACGGCFRGQPPHTLQEARKRERLLVCDGCGRLVMLPPEDAAGA